MRLRIVYIPTCEWRADAISLGKEVARGLNIEFEDKEKDIRDGGISPAFFLDEIELFPINLKGAGCRSQLPSKYELITEIKLRMKHVEK